MNFAFLIKKIEESKEFKDFKKEHKDLYLAVGFFILDYEKNINQQQLDYSLKNGEVFTFSLENEAVKMKPAQTIEGSKEQLKKLDKKIKIDLEETERKFKEELKKQNEKSKITKIIAVLQENEGKQIWNLNCMLDGMNLIHAHIDSKTGEILKFEKKNMFDFIKKIK